MAHQRMRDARLSFRTVSDHFSRPSRTKLSRLLPISSRSRGTPFLLHLSDHEPPNPSSCYYIYSATKNWQSNFIWVRWNPTIIWISRDVSKSMRSMIRSNSITCVWRSTFFTCLKTYATEFSEHYRQSCGWGTLRFVSRNSNQVVGILYGSGFLFLF